MKVFSSSFPNVFIFFLQRCSQTKEEEKMGKCMEVDVLILCFHFSHIQLNSVYAIMENSPCWLSLFLFRVHRKCTWNNKNFDFISKICFRTFGCGVYCLKNLKFLLRRINKLLDFDSSWGSNKTHFEIYCKAKNIL